MRHAEDSLSFRYMGTIRRGESKAALGQQRAELRRRARGKVHIGDDTGAGAGRAAELAKVHRMQELLHEEERASELPDLGARQEEQQRAEQAEEPLLAIALDIVADGLKIARTLVALPFRLALALRPRWLRSAHA